MHLVLANCLGGLSLLRISVVRLTDSPNMTITVYHEHKTTTTIQICIIKCESKAIVGRLLKKKNLSLYNIHISLISSVGTYDSI